MGAFPKHPAEVHLLAICRKFELDERNTELLRDLLGYKYSDRSSYFGIEPNVSRYIKRGSVRSSCAEISASIANLLRNVIGTELMMAVDDNPIKVLRSELDFSRFSAAWLVAQLKLQEKAPEVAPEIARFRKYTCKRMINDVVIPTLRHLLEVREQQLDEEKFM